MENQVIEKINRSVQAVDPFKPLSAYPGATVHSRLITTRIVGVTYENRQEVVAKLQMGDRVWLEQEPHNRFDHNAIKILRINGEQLGYINRELAQKIAPIFSVYGKPIRGKVTLLTGGSWGNYSLGAMISFKLPKRTPSQNSSQDAEDGWDDWDD